MSVRDDISGKMVLNLDLNFPPLECWLAEGTSGSRHPWISITQIGDAIESQQGSTAPPSDRLNNSIIDLESIEDEVVTLASSRGFPQVLPLVTYLYVEETYFVYKCISFISNFWNNFLYFIRVTR